MELVALSQSSDGVQAVIRNSAGLEERFESSWLIGCDGAHSSVRHLLDLPFEGEAYPEAFLLADVKIIGPLDHIHIHQSHGPRVAVAVLPGCGSPWRRLVLH